MKYILLSAAFICFSGCSSAVRFSSGQDPEEKKAPKEVVNPVTTPTAGAVTGVASYYGKKFHGKKTASGELYDMNELTAAHSTYPFNTEVKVTNLKNNKTVIVRINDRKPDMHGRIIDISYAAAKELDMVISGIANVQLEVITH